MLSALLDHGHDLATLPSSRLAAPLQVQAAGTGYEQRLNEVYSWDGMQRGTSPFLVIQHTVLGEGRLDYEGREYRLRPGQTMLVMMPHAHRYWLPKRGKWEYFWLLLHGREALRIARDILATSGPVLRPSTGQIDAMATSCLRLLSEPEATPGMVSSIAYQALAALHDCAFGGAASGPDHSPPVGRVLAHVEGNLSSPLPVGRLAALAGMSRAHFVRRFTSEIGVPPSEHVMVRRIERVERLLIATEMTVDQIARLTGFADGNYLAKVFRRRRSMTPLDFRATRAEAG